MLPLHVESGVDNVLQDLWASDLSRLGHMAHNKDWDLLALGNADQRARAFPDLLSHSKMSVARLSKFAHPETSCKRVSSCDFLLGILLPFFTL